MSESEKPVAEGQLNKKEGSAVIAHHESVRMYFHHQSEDIIILSEEAASNLDNHAHNLMVCVDEHNKANEIYSHSIELYGKVNSHPEQSAELSNLEDKVAESEKILQEKKEKLQKILGDFEAKGAGYKEVVELIPIASKKGTGRGRGVGSRYVYAKKGYVDNLGTGVKHRVSLRGADRASAKESIFKRDAHGNIKSIDTQKLKSQLKKIETDNTGVKLFDAEDLVKIDKTLFGWADSWNNSLVSNGKVGEHLDLSAGAQFMRFTTNVGASGEWDPANGKVTFKGEASTVLSLASGTASAKYYIPDRMGWSLKLMPPKGKTEVLNMGMLRIYCEVSLIGFAGASVQVESQLQVTTLGAKQVIMGKRGEQRLPRFSERRATGAEFHQAREKNEEGVTVSGDIFAGARAEFKLTGGVQWLQPPALTSHQGKTGDAAKDAAEFVDFCSISESIVGMAGIGVGGTFQCDFVNGKFCFKIAASLCVGVGGKGHFEAAVDYDKLYDFAGWLVYQIYGLDYAFFDVVSKEAFQAFSKICVMLWSDIKHEIEEELRSFTGSIVKIERQFGKFISSIEDGLQASEKRNQLANNILVKPGRVLKNTPETKGILLYLLTRHGTWDHVDIDNRFDGVIPDIYHARKKAVLAILSSIQTQREWFQVFSHYNAEGTDLAAGNSALKYMVAQNKMNELTEFLQEGLNKDKEMDKIYRRLKPIPAWGYALAMNNTDAYRLCTVDNPLYPKS